MAPFCFPSSALWLKYRRGAVPSQCDFHHHGFCHVICARVTARSHTQRGRQEQSRPTHRHSTGAGCRNRLACSAALVRSCSCLQPVSARRYRPHLHPALLDHPSLLFPYNSTIRTNAEVIMPIPHGAIAGAMLLRQLQRRCPHCGAEFVVPPEKKNDSVDCSICGTHVPPKQST